MNVLNDVINHQTYLISSYEEWKRLQTIQKAQYHQQMANQYKTALESK